MQSNISYILSTHYFTHSHSTPTPTPYATENVLYYINGKILSSQFEQVYSITIHYTKHYRFLVMIAEI